MYKHNAGVVLNLTPIKGRLTNEDGTVVEVDRKAGSVYWSEKVAHSAVNLSGRNIDSLFFELK